MIIIITIIITITIIIIIINVCIYKLTSAPNTFIDLHETRHTKLLSTTSKTKTKKTIDIK